MAKILIVDDAVEIAQILSLRLSKLDSHETFIAYNGKEGLRLAEEKLPDIILLDLAMPGLDGIEVMKALKAKTQTAHIPIIFITAIAHPEDLRPFIDQGMCEYITKPFDWQEVMGKIEKCLKK